MIINLHGKQIELTDWQKITAFTRQKDSTKNWARRPIENDIEAPYANGVVLMRTYYPDEDFPKFWWTPQFFGKHISSLKEFYDSFYKEAPSFIGSDIEKAKAHIDGFLNRFNNLAVFL